MYVSTFLIFFSYICYSIMIFIGNKYKVSKDNGFDASKDIISEYNSINVIEERTQYYEQ